MDKVLGEVQGLIPKIHSNTPPETTGPTIPTPSPMKELKF